MKRLFHILIPVIVLLLIADCAKIGSPSGGPRDEDPPRIKKTKPLNHSVNYEGNEFEVSFDEFITTQDIGQEMVVSPPLEERPEIRLRGKTLVIEWDEDLHDSTTYTFSFGESIKDLNEGNILSNYEFVFSTGGYLDSLAVLGTVLQAFDLKPHNEKIFVMLYTNLSDSAPLLEIPDYVGKADANGNFLINNVRPATYRLFALQDMNRNYKYDVPEEYIGFLDSALVLDPSLFELLLGEGKETVPTGSDSTGLILPDSLTAEPVDSVILETEDSTEFILPDSLTAEPVDSLTMEGDSLTLADLAPWGVFVDIFLFQEDKKPQYLIEHSRKDRRRFTMRFNRRVTDTVILEPYDFGVEGDWYMLEEHVMNDTFDYWLTDSLIYLRDSLTVLATYPVTDSLLNYVPFYDTLRFNYRESRKSSTARRRRQQSEETEQKEMLALTLTLGGGSEQDLHLPLFIEAGHPIAETDTAKISLLRRQDTLDVETPFRIVHDSNRIRRYLLYADWELETNYTLNVFPGAFTDIYGLGHDTITRRFKVRNPEYYGRILLQLSGVRGPVIIQALDNKGKPAFIKFTGEDGLVEFRHVPPSTFTLKLIHDANANGKWDTGEYLEHRQPEAVEFYPEAISVRSNFDMEVNWELKVPDLPEPDPNENREGIEPFEEGSGSNPSGNPDDPEPEEIPPGGRRINP